MPQTAFVTGGTGFLGRHIVEQLTRDGWRVIALHRPASNVKHLSTYPVELVVGTLGDPDSIARALPEGCDAVFHVAGNTSLWSGGNAQQTRDNVDGTRAMVEAALAKKAKRFIHTSSVATWGAQSTIPFDEDAPQHALGSFINYERTKYLGEVEVDRGVARGLSAVVMNPGHIIGRYDATGWARTIRLVYGGKLPGIPPGAGSFAAAAEVARAHIAAVDRGRAGGRYLLGGADATYVEFVRIIGELTGRKVPSRALPAPLIRAFARLSQWGSHLTRRAPTMTPEIAAAFSRPPHYFKSDRAVRELGYRAAPLRDMVRESFDWLKAEKLVD